LHPYVYAGDDPANQTDPTGHFWYDPINDRWVWNNVSYLEAPIRSKIEFVDDPDIFRTRQDTFDWIMPRSRQIKTNALQHGVPPELVAGILAVEIDNDMAAFDIQTDTPAGICFLISKMPPGLAAVLVHAVRCMCPLYLSFYSNVGLGVGMAQIHINREGYDWWAAVEHYRAQGYQLPDWADDPVEMLLSSSGAIEGVAIYGRALADLRTSNYSPHTGDLSINDMGLIFDAYRMGIAGFNTPPSDPRADFDSIADFQNPAENASDYGNGRFSVPYFEAFQFYFDHVNLYEAEYPEWRSQ
jgi:hypothetical protein